MMNNEDTMPLVEQIRTVINRTSRENRSNTHDFVLAEFLMAALEAFEAGVNERDRLKDTPPGESEWLRLDECEFECQVPVGSGNWYHDNLEEDSALVTALRHGPSAVRVRSKK